MQVIIAKLQLQIVLIGAEGAKMKRIERMEISIKRYTVSAAP